MTRRRPRHPRLAALSAPIIVAALLSGCGALDLALAPSAPEPEPPQAPEPPAASFAACDQTQVGFDPDLLLADHNARRAIAPAAPPLRRHPLLAQTASGYATYLAANETRGHFADGRDPVERLRAAARAEAFDLRRLRRTGENVWISARGAAWATDGWAASPPHDAVMRGDFTHVGFAVACRPDAPSRGYYVAVFAKFVAL